MERIWYRDEHWASLALLPLSWAYGAAAAVRRGCFRIGLLPRVVLSRPVVVAGNITVGGTGKTPLVLALARGLQARGLRPGVVCRSYRARASSAARVTSDANPAQRGDEAVLLAGRLDAPVWSGPDRLACARALLDVHPECDVVLCDDGLQHHALARDVEIAVIDGARGLGNGRLLPAGPLREPPCRLNTVDAIVTNGSIAPDPQWQVPVFRMNLVGRRFVAVADPGRTASPEDLAGAHLVACAGIGNPERFFAHLRTLGLAFEPHPFPDHHAYRAPELAFPSAHAILMTEKDAIKCRSFADPRMWMLPVHAEIPEALIELVARRVRDARLARP